ncbi:tetratricopeptide repeat protein, partial [Pyxidicoccus sp. 3LG]
MVGLGAPPAWTRPLFPPPVRSQLGPASPEISRARAQMDAGDFEEARRTLLAGLDSADLTDDQLVELYRLLGLTALYLGDEAQAREAYEKLLQARPDYELPRGARRSCAPSTRASRRTSRAAASAPSPWTWTPFRTRPAGSRWWWTPPSRSWRSAPAPAVFYRRAGDVPYNSVDFVRERGTERFRAVLPAYDVPAEPEPYEVEYYFEVADAAQRRLAGRGDSFQPLVFQ